jgi:hypothetical protein
MKGGYGCDALYGTLMGSMGDEVMRRKIFFPPISSTPYHLIIFLPRRYL